MLNLDFRIGCHEVIQGKNAFSCHSSHHGCTLKNPQKHSSTQVFEMKLVSTSHAQRYLCDDIDNFVEG